MRASGDPLHYVWWLAGRASGVVAMVLISLAVVMGLSMAAKVVTRPRVKRVLAKLHEHIALAAIGSIGIHGLTLMEDPWLKAGWRGVAEPFAMSYRPAFTGLGILGGYLAVLLGPSFYLRRRIGARRWRRLHSLLVVAWLMCGVHTIGAGSDGRKLWLEAIVAAPVAPVVYLLILRVLRPESVSARRAASVERTPEAHALTAAADAAGA